MGAEDWREAGKLKVVWSEFAAVVLVTAVLLPLAEEELKTGAASLVLMFSPVPLNCKPPPVGCGFESETPGCGCVSATPEPGTEVAVDWVLLVEAGSRKETDLGADGLNCRLGRLPVSPGNRLSKPV